MAKQKLTFDAVWKIALALPEVDQGTVYGTDAVKVGGKMFACRAINKSAEPDTLVVCIGFTERDELIAADPATYYLTPHYVNYPIVLVRLNRVHRDALRDLLQAARRFVSTSRRRPAARSRRR
jgi:hypothetical protein